MTGAGEWRSSQEPPLLGCGARPHPCPPGGAGPDPPSARRYRKAVSNVCKGGVDLQRSPEQLQCPLTPPRGLRVSVRGGGAAVRPWEDVLFEVQQEQVSTSRPWAGPSQAQASGEKTGLEGGERRVERVQRGTRLQTCVLGGGVPDGDVGLIPVGGNGGFKPLITLIKLIWNLKDSRKLKHKLSLVIPQPKINPGNRRWVGGWSVQKVSGHVYGKETFPEEDTGYRKHCSRDNDASSPSKQEPWDLTQSPSRPQLPHRIFLNLIHGLKSLPFQR